jgi:hypothetical protein
MMDKQTTVDAERAYDALRLEPYDDTALIRRIGQARIDYIGRSGSEPIRLLLGQDLYTTLCWVLDVIGLGTLYGMDVIVLPIPDACVCTGDNNDTAYRMRFRFPGYSQL